MKEKIYENGIEYILTGDYYLPNFELPTKKYHIGKLWERKIIYLYSAARYLRWSIRRYVVEKAEWVLRPACGSKARDRIRGDNYFKAWGPILKIQFFHGVKTEHT